MAPGAAGGCEVRGGGGELGSDGGESNPPRHLRSVPSAGAPEPAGAGLALLGFGSEVQFNPFSTDGMLNVQASARALLPCAQGGGGAAARAGLGEEQPELAPADPGPPEPHTPPGEGPGDPDTANGPLARASGARAPSASSRAAGSADRQHRGAEQKDKETPAMRCVLRH